MDEDDEYTTETLPAVKAQAMDAVVLVLDCMGGFFRVMASGFADATMIAARHANYKLARREMHEQGALEIERLVSGE